MEIYQVIAECPGYIGHLYPQKTQTGCHHWSSRLLWTLYQKRSEIENPAKISFSKLAFREIRKESGTEKKSKKARK